MKLALALFVIGCSCSREPPSNSNAEQRAAASATDTKPEASAAAAVASAVPTPVPSSSEPNRRCITPESVGATPLVALKGSSERERRAVAAARAELTRVLERPSDFYATVQATDDLVLLELWHRSAFLPENCNDRGNPGGKCRTLGYDPKRDRITSTKFWQ